MNLGRRQGEVGFAFCLVLLIVPMVSTAFTNDAIGQTIRRVVITSAVDGNGANPCLSSPPPQPGFCPITQETVSKTITFSFRPVTGLPNVGFLCSLNGKAFVSCTSPITYTNLAPGTHTFQVKDKSTVPQTPAGYVWTVLTPAQGIERLKSFVNGMQGVSSSTKASLNARLDGALRYLTDSNTLNDRGACTYLDGFIRTANSFVRADRISAAQGQQLIQTLPFSANAIKSSIGCP